MIDLFPGAPFNEIVVLDAETRWSSKDYTLSKMTTESYIRDPRFKAFGFSMLRLGDNAPKVQWYSHDELPRIFGTYDWSKTAVVAHNCVTGDHEVRTRAGWVRFDQLEDGIDVMQWDPTTGAMTYTPAVVLRKQYKGVMYKWDTSYHKGVYTPNHRMFFCTPATSTWREAPAAEVAGMGPNNTYIPTAGWAEGDTAQCNITPHEARILEMVRADGNITPRMDPKFRFKRKDKVQRCKALLDSYGATYHESVDNGVTRINVHKHSGIRALCSVLGSGKSKRLGEWVLHLSYEARGAMLDEVQYWDGVRPSKGAGGQTVVFTHKREDAYWLSEAAITTGRSAVVVYDIPNTRGFSRPDSVLHRVSIRARHKAKLVERAETVNFDGVVYCLTTPTGAFMVRRNGATWMTGNSQFDVGIMEWVYDVHPVFIFDTLSMARALFGTEVGNSLKKLSEAFGLPPKGNAVHNTDGLEELDPEVERELAAYCCHDTELASILFSKRLMRTNPYTGHVAGLFPIKELRLIDMTCKMFTRPQLHLDSEMLEEAIDDEQTKREVLLQRLGVTDSMLASSEQFGELLRQLNVEPPTKPSPTNPNKLIPALAKSDAKFQALLNSDNDDVAALCEARLKVKSTQERTRAQRFLDISRRGVLPVPLAYYGAATGRWAASKGAAINMQNMKRGSFLRKAIMAPEGHVLVVGDLSQIEPRVLAWLADYEALLDIFRSGQDAYAMFGRQMFNKPDLTKETDPDLRQSAKSALLGAGYGLGWASFAQQLLTGFLGAPPMRYDKAFAKKLGVTGDWAQRFLSWERNQEAVADIAANCTQEQLVVHCMAAARIIEIYRDTASPVTSFWDTMSNMLDRCLYGGDEMTYKCLTFRKEEIVLPNGMSLRYPNLRLEKDKNDPKGRMQYVYDDGKGVTKLYAGKITNNVTQAVARIVMTDGMLRVAKRYFVAGTVHDEQIDVAPEDEAQEAKAWVLEQMIKEPAYLPGIPLAAEVGVHRRYGLAKG